MPRIELERKVPVCRDIFEVRHLEYELPDQIVLDGVLMTYNERSGFYESSGHIVSVSARDYLRAVLKEKGIAKESSSFEM